MKKLIVALLLILIIPLSVDANSFFGSKGQLTRGTFVGGGFFGGFSPVYISDLLLWVKSTDGVTLDTSTGTTTVSTWANQASTGSAYDAAQATKASQPTYITEALNGYPVLRFDGSNDFLGLTSATAKSATRNIAGLSAFVVLKSSNTGTQHQVFTISTGTNSVVPRFGINKSTTNILSGTARALDADTGAFVGGAVTDSTDYQVVSQIADYAAPLLSIYKAGTLVSSSSSNITAGNTSDTDSRAVSIGARGTTAEQFLTGDIAEIILYARALTAAEQQVVERYLGQKYALTVASIIPLGPYQITVDFLRRKKAA